MDGWQGHLGELSSAGVAGLAAPGLGTAAGSGSGEAERCFDSLWKSKLGFTALRTGVETFALYTWINILGRLVAPVLVLES